MGIRVGTGQSEFGIGGSVRGKGVPSDSRPSDSRGRFTTGGGGTEGREVLVLTPYPWESEHMNPERGGSNLAHSSYTARMTFAVLQRRHKYLGSNK